MKPLRILWHSAAYWEPTGYGTQTATWTDYLAKQGHEVIESARTSLMYQIASHNGRWVLPGPPFSGEGVQDEMLPGHVKFVEKQIGPVDLVIILYDGWHFGLPPERYPQVPIAFWVPIDSAPMDEKEQTMMAGGHLYPVAMSKFGSAQMKAAGIAHGYIPHGINTAVWQPLPSMRHELRDMFKVPRDAFVIGMNSACTDVTRKGIWEQLEAFSIFLRKHPGAVMMIHSLPAFRHGADIARMVQVLGIPSAAIRVPDPYDYLRGAISGDNMLHWYNALDVLTNCSYGEGFGLAAVEAQACGIPVILSKNSTGPELVGPGWLVETQHAWQGTHRAQWGAPFTKGIVKAYEAAWRVAANPDKALELSKKCWRFAEAYDVERVGPMWEPVLQAATGRT